MAFKGEYRKIRVSLRFAVGLATGKTPLVYAENIAPVKPFGNDVVWSKGLLSGKYFQELVAASECYNACFCLTLAVRYCVAGKGSI